MLPPTATFETYFINALITAGTCSNHRRKTLCFSTYIKKQQHSAELAQWSPLKTDAEENAGLDAVPDEPERLRSPEELLELVDDYREEDGLPAVLPELPLRYQPPDGPHLTVMQEQEDEWPPPGWAPSDPEIIATLRRLMAAIKDWSVDHEELSQLYKELPEPRATHLPAHVRHRLLHRLSIVERKDEASMLRYFAILDDMKIAAAPLLLSEWNSAISFAARYVHFSTEVEVETALHLWREMEQTTGLKANHVTFNILFDVACKAGKFVLAEMVYKEMQARGLEFDRYYHVTLIEYHGLRKNGDAVRLAYKDLVKRHELVDTRVLNVMMHALINCEEENAAENIYERMKKAHIEYAGDAPLVRRNWLTQRWIDRSLTDMARIVRADPSRAEEIKRKSILSPNIHTYRILVGHFAVEAGQLERTLQLHEDMKRLDVPLDEMIFLSLLRGFAFHGGVLYTQWEEDRLENVWNALLHGVDRATDNLIFTRRLVVWALRAFGKCSGKLRTLKAWEEVKLRWDMDDADIDFISRRGLRLVMDGRDSREIRNDWLLGSG